MVFISVAVPRDDGFENLEKSVASLVLPDTGHRLEAARLVLIEWVDDSIGPGKGQTVLPTSGKDHNV